MVDEAIKYDPDFFAQVLQNKVYRIKNTIALTACLEEIYSELDKWVKIEDGSAVITDSNQFSPINYVPTNSLAMTLILNRVNDVLRFLQNQGILSLEGPEGEPVSTDQLDFMTNHLGNMEGFEKEFDRFHRILAVLKEDILVPGSRTYDQIMAIAQESYDVEQAGNNLFTKNIQTFFPQATDLAIKKYQGDNLTTGIDVEFRYRGLSLCVQVRQCEKIEHEGDYYKIYSDFNPTVYAKCDYYAFILPDNYIYIFENDKARIRSVTGNELFTRTMDQDLSFLFHADTLRNHKKVF